MFKTLATLVFISFVSLSAFGLQEHPDGSLTLSKQEVAVLEKNMSAAIQAAYQSGVKDGASEALEVLKDNPKLCPKDI